MRPSRPKYDQTWDPKIVLDFYENLINKDLNLKDLSKKLVLLLALITGHRMQTLSLIKIANIRKTESRLETRIPDRIKTSKRNATQSLLILPLYPNQKICVATTLISYLYVTKQIRGALEKLFISIKKPYKVVFARTLSRWVNEAILEAGTDTKIFSAYSTRHASTSAAKRVGVDLELIRKTAGWSKNPETFARFYNGEINLDSQQFVLSILNL